MQKLKNPLLSALIRKRRKELNWKQESLIIGMPISLSYYSEIERGNRAIPEDLLSSIWNKLQLPIFNDTWYTEHQKKIELLKKYLYYCSHSKIATLYNELIKESNSLQNSLLFLDYELTIFMYNSSYSHTVEKKQIKFLDTYYDLFSDEQKYIFRLYCGIYEKHLHHPERSFKYFKSLLDSKEKYSYYTEILYYHSAIYFIQKGHLTVAQHLNKEAESLFLKEHNMNRLAYTMMHEAIIYTQENHYIEAEEIYDKLLEGSYGLSSRALNTALCNACFNSMKARHNEKAILYCKNLKPGWQDIPEIFNSIAWILLQTNQEKELDDFLAYSKQFSKNKFIDDMLEIIDLQRKPDSEKKIETKLKNCEKYLIREGSSEVMIFVYEQLIQYYETRSIVKQVKYLKKLNELNKRGMQYEQ